MECSSPGESHIIINLPAFGIYRILIILVSLEDASYTQDFPLKTKWQDGSNDIQLNIDIYKRTSILPANGLIEHSIIEVSSLQTGDLLIIRNRKKKEQGQHSSDWPPLELCCPCVKWCQKFPACALQCHGIKCSTAHYPTHKETGRRRAMRSTVWFIIN